MMNLGDIKNIHFVGIGGSGMSAMAEVLHARSHTVSGCDQRVSPATDRLRSLGIDVAQGHDAAHVEGIDVLVMSSAVHANNPEVARAREKGVPVVRRAEMLGTLLASGRSIAVAGTHGKTTTTAMTARVLTDAGLDPTVIVGGVVQEAGSGARVGASDLFVAEADEFDRSFLALEPTWAVITNIESDHLDCYRDLDDIKETFVQFAERISREGVLIACADDPRVRSLIGRFRCPVVTYGTSMDATLRAAAIEHSEAGVRFDVLLGGEQKGRVTLRVRGEHNVRNALAAIGAGLELGVPFDTIATALGAFTGVERRFQILGTFGGAIVVDDYAHHPTEIRATLEAARRSYPGRRLVALFQPHLYSRTRDFSAGFAEALVKADLAFVSPIYPAREAPIEGVDAGVIVAAAHESGASNLMLLDGDTQSLADRLRSVLQAGDLFVAMGAGDVHRVAESLVREAVA